MKLKEHYESIISKDIDYLKLLNLSLDALQYSIYKYYPCRYESDLHLIFKNIKYLIEYNTLFLYSKGLYDSFKGNLDLSDTLYTIEDKFILSSYYSVMELVNNMRNKLNLNKLKYEDDVWFFINSIAKLCNKFNTSQMDIIKGNY